jgi:hypothetical protein
LWLNGGAQFFLCFAADTVDQSFLKLQVATR